jgi:hypothetical protein
MGWGAVPSAIRVRASSHGRTSSTPQALTNAATTSARGRRFLLSIVAAVEEGSRSPLSVAWRSSCRKLRPDQVLSRRSSATKAVSSVAAAGDGGAVVVMFLLFGTNSNT